MLNHVSIMGRLTRDPELRSTANGISVTSITLAVDRDFGRSEEKQADFIDVVCWRQTAEFVSKYFHKGSMMAVSGRLQQRRWEDKEGAKRSTVEIVADNCYFCERKSDSSQPYGASASVDYGPPPPERRSSYGSNSPSPSPSAPPPSYDYQDTGSFSEMDDDGEVPF